jgi:hypothetical protein
MTIYYVSSVDGNDSDSGLDWTNAKATLAGAIAVATTAGDIIKVSHVHTEELGSATTYTAGSAYLEIWSVNRASSDAPTPQGTSYWIGNSTTNRAVSIIPASAGELYVYGLTIRTAGSTSASISLNNGTPGHLVLDNCYLWGGNTGTNANVIINAGTGTVENYTELRNSTLRFGNAVQTIYTGAGVALFENCAISADSSAITPIFDAASASGVVRMVNCDLSAAGASIVGNQSNGYKRFEFINCKLKSSFGAMDAQTTNPNNSACDVYLYNCYDGDQHYHFQHHNALGSLVTDPANRANDSITDTALSWKIITTANATTNIPYVSPWISAYHTGTSAITPSLEGLFASETDAAAGTVAQNDEIWGEFSVQATSGFPLGVLNTSDKMALGGTAADQTSAKATTDWTISTSNDAYKTTFKLAPTATITPAEVGHVMARVCVGIASKTFFVDPQIRGLS